jgi:DNA polymerase
MHHIILDSEIDFDGWRQAARTLALNGVNPSDVTWTVRGRELELFEAADMEEPPEPPQATFSVPAKFIGKRQADAV